MGTIGGPRHYTGGGTGAPYKWPCPTCHAENVTPLEAGCPQCGAGTPGQAVAAKTAPLTIGVAELAAHIVEDQDVAPEYWLALPGLTEAAKVTVAVALARYAELATATTSDQLRTDIALAWARRLMEIR